MLNFVIFEKRSRLAGKLLFHYGISENHFTFFPKRTADANRPSTPLSERLIGIGPISRFSFFSDLRILSEFTLPA